MKKNSILLYAMTLIMAFCFAPSVMAKKLTYPNGSCIQTDEQGIVSEWEVKYPDGYVLKYDDKEGKRVIYSDGTIIYFSDDIKRDFNNYSSQTKIYYVELLQIVFPKSQISKLSSEEVAKLINEKISQAFAYYKYKEHLSNGKKFYGLYVYDGDKNSEIGKYYSDDGVYISNKEQAAKDNAAAKEQAAKEQAAFNQLSKKYGKKYAAAFMNGDVIVGMPEGLIKKYIHKIKSQSTTSKTYYMLPYYGAPDYKRTMTVYVTNGRVTGFVDHR